MNGGQDDPVYDRLPELLDEVINQRLLLLVGYVVDAVVRGEAGGNDGPANPWIQYAVSIAEQRIDRIPRRVVVSPLESKLRVMS